MILITAGVTTVIVCALWMLGIAGAAYFVEENSPSFSVNIFAPSTAEVGETVVVLMEISNPTDQTLTLNTIDLADTLLDGFKVTSVSPSASSYNSFGTTSYQFSKTISAGESYEVTLVLEATKPGVWTGDVDFSNPTFSFVTSSTTIRVNKPGSDPVWLRKRLRYHRSCLASRHSTK